MEITIIGHAETLKYLRQKELYWYFKLKTYALFGLNERDVTFKLADEQECFNKGL